MKLVHLALAASLLAAAPAHAVVITDGTFGAQKTLAGTFDIPYELGRRAGANLFHSFSRFDLSATESATFTGPASIQNIISRVTGGHVSNINGQIASGIPGANLYLVNPSGIMFGPSATLDVDGSFYATTADYLQIGPVRLDASASVPGSFDLAIVPPSAFGFLDANPAPIVIADSCLSVPGTLNLIGGDIAISRIAKNSGDLISSPYGFTLVSAGSAGEASVSDAGFDTSTFSKMGRATVSSFALSRDQDAHDIVTSAGRIFIVAGSFIVDGADIASVATGAGNGGNLSVSAPEVKVTDKGNLKTSSQGGKAGDVSIAATGSITISENSAIQTGRLGSITLQAPAVTLQNNGVIKGNFNGNGNGGDLKITTGELKVTGLGSTISDTNGTVSIDTDVLTMSEGYIVALTSTTGSGNKGDVQIKVKDAMVLTDKSNIGTSGKDAGSVTIDAPEATVTLDRSYIYIGNWFGDSTAAPITLSAKDIKIKNEGRITSISGPTTGGDIRLNATGGLVVSGKGVIVSNSRGFQDAGNIEISASTVLVEDGGRIHTLVGDPDKPREVAGNGGSISIHAAESVTISGPGSKIDVSTKSLGNAGTLAITSPLLHLENRGRLSSASQFTGVDAGNAGLIDLHIGKVLSLDFGFITTDAQKAAGGNIRIDPVLVYLRNRSGITTSVHGGKGDGGNISLAADAVMLEGSRIAANADQGHGGRVGITAALYLADLGSKVTASSERGIPGTVDISAPLVDVSGNLVLLPERMLEDDDLAPRTCAVSDDSSSFIVRPSPLQNRPERNLLAF